MKIFKKILIFRILTTFLVGTVKARNHCDILLEYANNFCASLPTIAERGSYYFVTYNAYALCIVLLEVIKQNEHKYNH